MIRCVRPVFLLVAKTPISLLATFSLWIVTVCQQTVQCWRRLELKLIFIFFVLVKKRHRVIIIQSMLSSMGVYSIYTYSCISNKKLFQLSNQLDLPCYLLICRCYRQNKPILWILAGVAIIFCFRTLFC